jgi:hypothetical protein
MRSPIKVLDSGAEPGPAGATAPQVEIVVPVRNEEQDLAPSIRRLHAISRCYNLLLQPTLRVGFPATLAQPNGSI